MAGRPPKHFDIKTFQDLVGLGCSQEEICWFFRDEKGRPANVDTLSRWCKRTFGMNFQEYFRQNSFMAYKIKLRKNQFKLSEKSAAMAIFLGKNYLGQSDTLKDDSDDDGKLAEFIEAIRGINGSDTEADRLIDHMHSQHIEEDQSP